jgi:bacterioferritin
LAAAWFRNHLLTVEGIKVKKIMLVLFSFAELDDVINRAFELLDEDDELQVVACIEREVPNSLSALISDVGFLGEKVTNDVKDTIIDEYKERANRNLDAISERGEEEDEDVEVDLLRSVEEIRERLRQEPIDYLIVNYTNDEFISEEVLKYPLDKLIEGIEYPYEIYYDGQLDEKEKGEEELN